MVIERKPKMVCDYWIYGFNLTTITLSISHSQNSELTPSQLFYNNKVQLLSAPLGITSKNIFETLKICRKNVWAQSFTVELLDRDLGTNRVNRIRVYLFWEFQWELTYRSSVVVKKFLNVCKFHRNCFSFTLIPSQIFQLVEDFFLEHLGAAS